jgi:hypothetical protein
VCGGNGKNSAYVAAFGVDGLYGPGSHRLTNSSILQEIDDDFNTGYLGMHMGRGMVARVTGEPDAAIGF